MDKPVSVVGNDARESLDTAADPLHPLLQLDIDAILRKRLGRGQRWLPRAVTSWLARVIHQNELNEMLRIAYPARGSRFSDALLRHLDIRLEVKGISGLDPSRRYLFACNHPLGGLDGIAMIKVLGEKFGDANVKFLVNDMLMNVEPLADVFLPINKYGAQGREAAKAINATYASSAQMLIFPAGLVSRLHADGSVSDLQWQKAFVVKAMEFDRDIVPVRFMALNSPRFYKLARRRKRLGIKVNLEQALLPGELCRCRDTTFRIIFGDPVPASALRASGRKPVDLASDIRSAVYSLS